MNDDDDIERDYDDIGTPNLPYLIICELKGDNINFDKVKIKANTEEEIEIIIKDGKFVFDLNHFDDPEKITDFEVIINAKTTKREKKKPISFHEVTTA